MNLRRIRLFTALYEEGHTGRTAARMFISQPALSQQIHKLEEELQVSLFHQEGRVLKPTLAAHTLYQQSLNILQTIEKTREVMSHFRNQESQQLNLGVLQTINAAFIPTLFEQLKQLPAQLSLKVYELSANEIEKRLMSGQLNLGISYIPARQPVLDKHFLYQDELNIVLPGDHDLCQFNKISLAQIEQSPMILLGEEFRVRQLWDEKLKQHGAKNYVHMEVNHIQSIIRALPGSNMVSILPALAQKLFPQSGLVWKSLSQISLPLDIGFLYKNKAEQQGLINLLAPLLSQP